MLNLIPPTPVESLLVLIGALAFDLFWGEPPTRFHPVVYFGYLIDGWKRLAPSTGKIWPFLYGMVAVLVSVVGLFLLAKWALYALWSWSALVALPVEVYLLKSCFSIRMLADEGLKVRRLLKLNRPDEARLALRSLVSRDTTRLDEAQICGAAIESVTENITDSVVAPLFFYAVFGLPGALAYRLAQTFDSMIGYRGRYEYLGKVAARLDDLLNLIPARLSALLLIVSASQYRGDRRNAWRIACRDHGKTASPNAGWTMAAMAGALRVQLVKVDHYALGDPVEPLYVGLINRAVAALYIVSAETGGLFIILTVVRAIFDQT